MADDVTLPGTGEKVATDDDGTRQWQLIKVSWGPLGTFNLADVATGKPLPVQLRGSDGTDVSEALPVTVLSVVPGVAATNLGKAINAPLADGDTGVAALMQRDDVTTDLTPADGDYVVPRTNIRGAVWVQQHIAGTATLTSLASSTTSAQLLAATPGRLGLTLYNTDANGVYIKYGTTASATSFTVLIPANWYWEMPHPIYPGRIDAIWTANGAGSLFATELSH